MTYHDAVPDATGFPDLDTPIQPRPPHTWDLVIEACWNVPGHSSATLKDRPS